MQAGRGGCSAPWLSAPLAQRTGRSPRVESTGDGQPVHRAATYEGAGSAARVGGVPGSESGEALVKANLRRPTEQRAREALIEPVRRRQLLGQEAGHRRLVATPAERPH